MAAQPTSRRYAVTLAKWAAAPAARESIRALMDPADGELFDWIRRLVTPYYQRHRHQLYGEDGDDLVDECTLELLEQARSQPRRLLDPDFTDEHLARIIKWIAKCRVIDLLRRQKSKRFFDIDEYGDGAEEGKWRPPPPALWVVPDHSVLDSYPAREAEYRQTRLVVNDYARTIRGQTKMRQVLAVFLCYTHELGKEEGCPRHWLVLPILLQRHVHLCEELRQVLQRAFPNVAYEVINSRLGHLRRSFHAFLVARGLIDWAEEIAMRLVIGRTALA